MCIICVCVLCVRDIIYSRWMYVGGLHTVTRVVNGECGKEHSRVAIIFKIYAKKIARRCGGIEENGGCSERQRGYRGWKWLGV